MERKNLYLVMVRDLEKPKLKPDAPLNESKCNLKKTGSKIALLGSKIIEMPLQAKSRQSTEVNSKKTAFAGIK